MFNKLKYKYTNSMNKFKLFFNSLCGTEQIYEIPGFDCPSIENNIYNYVVHYDDGKIINNINIRHLNVIIESESVNIPSNIIRIDRLYSNKSVILYMKNLDTWNPNDYLDNDNKLREEEEFIISYLKLLPLSNDKKNEGYFLSNDKKNEMFIC